MNTNSLAREVADILELPYNTRQGKAYEITKAILSVIVKGLRDGQPVKVDGFGIFELRTRPPTRRYHTFFGSKPLHRELTFIPETKYVIFKPTKPFVKELNYENTALQLE